MDEVSSYVRLDLLSADSGEKHEPASDADAAVVD